MARILGIDYGKKRTGIAVTDPLQIIVTGLDTVDTTELKKFIQQYFLNEDVEKVVLGLPIHKDGNYTYLKSDIDEFVKYLNSKHPSVKVDFIDESFTSVEAKDIIFRSGVKKSKRRDKKLVDKVSAVLILQKYLNHI